MDYIHSPLPRQHSTAIGCTKNYQPIELYTRIALRAFKVSYSDVGEGVVTVKFFLNTLYLRVSLFRTFFSFALFLSVIFDVVGSGFCLWLFCHRFFFIYLIFFLLFSLISRIYLLFVILNHFGSQHQFTKAGTLVGA